MDADEKLIDQTLEAATIDGIRNVLFLGPFAKRINFAAQQNRALNLVHALLVRGVLKSATADKSKPVAIVGAGFAGITLTTALHLLGYTVHLFEKKGDVLVRQRRTKHRLLHPTINAWPFSVTLDPTLAAPFFSWASTTCETVLAEVIDEFEKLVGAELRAKGRFHLKTEVIDFDPHRRGISLETKPKNYVDLFGLIIFATGFEEETVTWPQFPSSYWKDEGAEHLLSDEETRFVVSGIGDGGLIDTLRLSFETIAVGILAVRVATMLQTTDEGRQIGADIRNAETDFAQDRTNFDLEKLWSAYQTAADGLPEPVTALLEKHRIRASPAVLLVGSEARLVAREAAPIHKLLATYNEGMGSIRYQHAKERVDEHGKISFESLNDAPVRDNAPNFLIARHGAPNALRAFILKKRPASDLEVLVESQRVLADNFTEPLVDFGEFYNLAFPLGWRPTKPSDVKFREGRRVQLNRLSEIWPHFVSIARSEEGFVVESADLAGWAPSSLYGVPVSTEAAFGDSHL